MCISNVHFRCSAKDFFSARAGGVEKLGMYLSPSVLLCVQVWVRKTISSRSGRTVSATVESNLVLGVSV